ncbi:efflux RND transporter periplasmic adaptor subunit [Peristeroidobacter soli]|uniref:efflux RND transporter periplasmic adaptor subunit n=1 Tax=Peristeroidobacter soli TaxID=2497877 RepID=UPI00101B7D6E|nr:efflux RND transporter periplasmic adaptor subunit [Peristeroidobacter soli]
MRRLTPFVAAGLALLSVGCSHEEPERAGASVPVLETVVISPRPTPIERLLDGTVEAVNQGTVAAQTSGRVTEILYDVNDFVPAGAVIMRLRATEQQSGLKQAEAALQEARARELEAQTRYKRVADMYERQVVPKATFDEATAARDSTVARLAAARAALDTAKEGVSYTEIRAPYAGVVTKRLVEPGESVHPGTPLMSGLSLQYLRVSVDVPQSSIDAIRRIKQAAVYIDGRRVEVSKLTVFPEAAKPSNTFRARLELPENAADLYPGMFVKVGFVTGEARRLLAPLSSVVERGEVTALYIVNDDGRASLRQVRLGHKFEKDVEVLAGLAEGERVALDPVAAMKQLRRAEDLDS